MSNTTTENRIGEMLTLTTARTMGLAKGLLNGVDAKDFAKQPMADGKVIDTNHPAFVYGHLAIYPAKVMGMLGHDGASAACPDSWEEMFKNGAVCTHDADNSNHPSMDEIIAKFESGYAALIEATKATSDDVLLQPIAEEGWRDVFGTNGGMVGFMLHDHFMFHLGQMSAWRRAMGLGSAM
ncbi:MAG: DinB family protein [Phycisphaerales bacterium]